MEEIVDRKDRSNPPEPGIPFAHRGQAPSGLSANFPRHLRGRPLWPKDRPRLRRKESSSNARRGRDGPYLNLLPCLLIRAPSPDAGPSLTGRSIREGFFLGPPCRGP